MIRSKKTDRRGWFNFRGLQSGYYWLVPDVHEHGLPFGIEIGKYGDEQCDTQFVLDPKGNPNGYITVTVDWENGHEKLHKCHDELTSRKY